MFHLNVEETLFCSPCLGYFFLLSDECYLPQRCDTSTWLPDQNAFKKRGGFGWLIHGEAQRRNISEDYEEVTTAWMH